MLPSFCLCSFLQTQLYPKVPLREMPLVLQPQHTAPEKGHSFFLPEEAFRWLCKSDVGIQSISEEGSFQSPLLVPIFDGDWEFCGHIAGTCLACQLILCHLREAWRDKEEQGINTAPAETDFILLCLSLRRESANLFCYFSESHAESSCALSVQAIIAGQLSGAAHGQKAGTVTVQKGLDTCYQGMCTFSPAVR